MAKHIMLQGTSSNVGKTIVTAAICRILKQDGYDVVPFKAQNMALNSFVTKDGLEMSRAQMVQAEAAGVEPTVEMNPILLKPTADASSQVIIMGKPVGVMGAKEYHKEYTEKIFTVVKKALEKLDKENEVVVLEGAGSPAEINLKDNDIVNMKVAKHLQSPVILIADIDRGGAIASLVGTVALLDEEELSLVKGFIINKFRGDVSLFLSAVDFLQEKTNIPVLGVLPYIEHLDIEDEDSVALDSKNHGRSDQEVQVVVIRLPRIANFTDFSPLEIEEGVNVEYVNKVSDLGNPDLIIIPGSECTTLDLLFLKETGLEEAIIRKNKIGIPIIGICGGFQILGQQLKDPDKLESKITDLAGLGLLPVVTTFVKENVTRQVKVQAQDNNFLNLNISGDGFSGFERHSGRTDLLEDIDCAFIINYEGESVPDGVVRSDGLVMGTYLHGLFENDKIRCSIINKLKSLKGIEESGSTLSLAERKEFAYNRLAKTVRDNLDMDKLYKIMDLKSK